MCVGNEELGAVEHVAIAVGLGGRGDAGGVEAGARLGQGERHDEVAGGDLGADFLLLRVAADGLDEAGGQHGADVGTGDERAAEFFEQHAEIEEVEAGAAEFLGGDEAHPALFGHAAPEVVGVAAVVLFHLAHELFGALVGEEVTSEVFQQFLFFGQAEIHAFLLPA